MHGTSHVSEESIALIDEKLDEHDPEIVALELDMKRLEALLTGDQTSDAPIFIRLIKYFQQKVGQKTGVMPGDEMLHAYSRCEQDDRDIALIDQDIRITLQRLNKIRRKEKVKAAGSLLLSLILPGSFDVSKIPEDEQIETLLEETRDRFPGIYQVLVEERNQYMAAALKQLQEENPEKDIVAFVGAGHKDALRDILEQTEIDHHEKEQPKDDQDDDPSRSLEDF